jgi:acyl-CoA oxidase
MSVDVRALKLALNPKYPELRQALKKLLKDQLFIPQYNISLDEERQLTRQRLHRVADLGLLTPQDYIHDPCKLFAIHEVIALADSSLVTAFTIQFNITIGSLMFLGTEKHRKYIPEALAMRITGVFCLTELGYGSNSIAIETTSTYQASSQTFELHTPSVNACKFWAVGYQPTHAVVFAQLINVEGDQGIHAFFVKLRGEDGSLLPGVEVVDLGGVAGVNGVGCNLLRFTRLRVPLEALLDRNGSIAPDGAYTSSIGTNRDRFLKAVERLSAGRLCLSVSCLSTGKMGLLIAYRYAAQRLAVGAKGKSDTPIFSYQLNQNALVPSLAWFIALEFGVQYANQLFLEDAPLLNTFVCILKSLTARTVHSCLRTARERMGGAGYLAVNRIANLLAASDTVLTAEGDTSVLLIKVATDLLKAANDGTYTAPQLSMCPVRQLPNVTDFDSLDLLLEVLRAREVFSFRELSAKLKSSSSFHSAVNYHASEGIQHLSKAYGERVLAEKFLEAISHNPAAAEVLSIAAHLFMLDAIKTDLGWLLLSKLVSPASAANVVGRWEAAIKHLAPLMGQVIEAFDIPEEMVRAPAAGDYVGYNDVSMKGELVPKL